MRATSPSCAGSMPRRRTGSISGLRTASASISMIRRGARDVRRARARVAASCCQSGVAVDSGGDENARVRRQRQQPLAQLAFQAVHDRQDDDERRHAQAHAQQRHPGDEGDEELVGAGPHVAQADEQGQGIQHRARFWRKNLTDITKALLDRVGSWRQRLTLPQRGVYCRHGRVAGRRRKPCLLAR